MCLLSVACLTEGIVKTVILLQRGQEALIFLTSSWTVNGHRHQSSFFFSYVINKKWFYGMNIYSCWLPYPFTMCIIKYNFICSHFTSIFFMFLILQSQFTFFYSFFFFFLSLLFLSGKWINSRWMECEQKEGAFLAT